MVTGAAYRPGRALRLACASLGLALAATVPGLASTDPRPPLREVEEIDHNMLWVAMAIEISDECDSIAPRTLKGLLFLNKLRGRALDMGYSKDEIEAYVTSDAEKARIRRLGENYVKSQGLDPENPADLCDLGQTEIARNSRIGALLRAK